MKNELLAARIIVMPEASLNIPQMLYGHFIEHLGRTFKGLGVDHCSYNRPQKLPYATEIPL